MPKVRLDLLMVERGLADSRALAQRLAMAGQVRVDGQVVIKPATKVSTEALVEIDHGSAGAPVLIVVFRPAGFAFMFQPEQFPVMLVIQPQALPLGNPGVGPHERDQRLQRCDSGTSAL